MRKRFGAKPAFSAPVQLSCSLSFVYGFCICSASDMAWMYDIVMLVILLYCQLCSGSVIEFKAVSSSSNLSQNKLTCKDDTLMYSCTVTGRRLTWNGSPELRFTSHNNPYDKLSIENKYDVILVNITKISDGVWKFTSELKVASSILPMNISCGSNESDLDVLQVSIAGVPEAPLITSFVLCGSDWPRNTTLFYNLTWEPPGNSNDFILDGYEVQFGTNTKQIQRRVLKTTISVVNESLDAVTLTAISTCGEKGSAMANVTQSDFAISYSTLRASANYNQATNNYFHDNSIIAVSLLGIFLSLTLLSSIILLLLLLFFFPIIQR